MAPLTARLRRVLAALVLFMAFCPVWAGARHEMTLAGFRDATGIEPRDLMYRQPYAVKRALDAMQPQHPGKTDLYYIGFAADAEEKVFTHDVELAQKRLKAYGATGHEMLLLNNIDHVYDMPLADAANLDAALKGVARRMDTREDVLVLFLSSHGASDASLWVHYPPLHLHDLHARQLRRMLDESGIRYRVIVISACYSGAFIDALKDDNTLVLTSSSRDHESYGCGDVTRYTEFTSAYFGTGLHFGAPFIDAFSVARNLIASKEKHDGLTPSNPQISIGRNIAQVLKRLPGIHAYHPELYELAEGPPGWAQNDKAQLLCPPPGGGADCSDRPIRRYIAAAWADYVKTHGRHMPVRYYLFALSKGVPAEGSVTIEISPNNDLLMEAPSNVVSEGGAARYTYDVARRKIVDRKYFR